MILRFFVLTTLATSLTLQAQNAADTGPLKWESSIEGFASRDAALPPPKDALLFVGSSSIRLWDLAGSWPNEPAINNGFGGSTLADSIHFFDQLFQPYAPKAVILYAGDNDINKGLDATEVARNFKTLASLISGAFPDVPVIYVAIKPSTARWELWPEMKKANDLIAALAHETPSWFYADIAAPMLEQQEGAPPAKWFVEDGLHLSEFGYAQWTGVVNEVLKEAGVKD